MAAIRSAFVFARLGLLRIRSRLGLKPRPLSAAADLRRESLRHGLRRFAHRDGFRFTALRGPMMRRARSPASWGSSSTPLTGRLLRRLEYERYFGDYSAPRMRTQNRRTLTYRPQERPASSLVK